MNRMNLTEAIDVSPQRSSILLVTDNEEIRSSLLLLLPRSGFSLESTCHGVPALKYSLSGHFDLILLDTSLAVLDGPGLLLEIRARSSVPVLVLAEREEDCVRALQAGADDYVLKPCHSAELLTRIRVLLRGAALSAGNSAPILYSDDLCLNLQTQQAWLRDEELSLTNTEFSILKCLVHSAGHIVSRDELAALLYQRESTPFERAIDMHISHLRKKMHRAGRAFIRTIRGVGYLLARGSYSGRSQYQRTAT